MNFVEQDAIHVNVPEKAETENKVSKLKPPNPYYAPLFRKITYDAIKTCEEISVGLHYFLKSRFLTPGQYRRILKGYARVRAKLEKLYSKKL